MKEPVFQNARPLLLLNNHLPTIVPKVKLPQTVAYTEFTPQNNFSSNGE